MLKSQFSLRKGKESYSHYTNTTFHFQSSFPVKSTYNEMGRKKGIKGEKGGGDEDGKWRTGPTMNKTTDRIFHVVYNIYL